MPENVTHGVDLSIHLSFESGVIAVKMKSENEEMSKYFFSECEIRPRDAKHGGDEMATVDHLISDNSDR